MWWVSFLSYYFAYIYITVIKKGGGVSISNWGISYTFAYHLHIVHILYILPQLPYFSHSTYYVYFAYFYCYFIDYKLSDDDKQEIQPAQASAPCGDLPDCDADGALSAALILPLPPVPALHPFDFHDFIRQSCGNSASLFRAIQQVDKQSPNGPSIVDSERSG